MTVCRTFDNSDLLLYRNPRPNLENAGKFRVAIRDVCWPLFGKGIYDKSKSRERLIWMRYCQLPTTCKIEEKLRTYSFGFFQLLPRGVGFPNHLRALRGEGDG